MRNNNSMLIAGIVSIVLLLGWLLISLSSLTLYAQDSQEIPLELAKKVAEHQVYEKWGKVQVGSVEIYYDLNGKPSAYVFTIYKGEGSVPTNEIITQSVNEARKLRISVEEKLKKIDAASDWREVKKLQQEVDNAWKNITQNEKFGTLVVSANNEHPPLLTVYDGLPPHFISIEDGKEVAIKELNVSDINIHKPLYLGNMVFVFQFSNGIKTVFVNAIDLQPLSDETVKAIANTARSPEQIARSKEKWLRLKQILNYSEEQK